MVHLTPCLLWAKELYLPSIPVYPSWSYLSHSAGMSVPGRGLAAPHSPSARIRSEWIDISHATPKILFLEHRTTPLWKCFFWWYCGHFKTFLNLLGWLLLKSFKVWQPWQFSVNLKDIDMKHSIDFVIKFRTFWVEKITKSIHDKKATQDFFFCQGCQTSRQRSISK